MWSLEIVAIVTAAFLLAGFVKGVVGLGLPTVSLAVLTVVIGLKDGIALMLFPAFATNVWQGLVGGQLVEIARRLWLFLLAACVGIWFGAGILAGADALLLSGFLGLILCLYAGISLVTPQIPPPGRWEMPISPFVGGVSGFVAGLTGSFVVPGTLYLQALGMSRDALIQAMGISFTVIVIAFAAGLGANGLLPAELGSLSVAAFLPALAGMVAGRAVRRRIPEVKFRRVFFGALFLLGVYLAVRAADRLF